jgi:hypothetical protein
MNDTPTKLKCGQTPTKAKCDRTPTPRTKEIWGAMLYTYPFLINCVNETEELETELTTVTEQRDRLAEALERILEYQGRFAEEDPESIAKEALQSLTKTEL